MDKKIKLSSTSQLENFLKILAEESIAKAYGDIASEKIRQSSISNGIKKASKAAYVKEEDETTVNAKQKAATPKPAAPPSPPSQAAPAEPAAPEEPAASPEPKNADEQTDITPTLDTLIRAIKEVRGGLGVSDSAVQDKLAEYFDQLSHEEQLALVVMLRSISDIMTKPEEVVISQMSDPSSYKIVMTMSKSQEPGEKQISSPGEEPTGSQVAPDEEDSSPPIKVGQTVAESYRKKIKTLLAKV